MRVLTVKQPWAWAIVHAGKDVENRGVAWQYRGTVAIHAGLAFDMSALEHPGIRAAVERHPGARMAGDLADHPFGASPTAFGIPMHRGMILGTVNLVGAHVAEDDCCPGNVWADRSPGTVHLRVRNARPFALPIPDVFGRLGLWRPDGALEELIEERHTAAVLGGAERALRMMRRDLMGGPDRGA